MGSLADAVDTKGRVNYSQLKELAHTMPLSEFVDQARMPFLVGKELYDGALRRDPDGDSTNTMRFSVNIKFRDDRTMDGGEPNSGITQAIYMLKKNLYSTTPPEEYTIGRAIDNDLVIADYVVSKHHATIYAKGSMFFISDMGSTNGTIVDSRPVPKEGKVQIFPGNTISFGRLAFVFAHPLAVFRGLRKEIFGA